MAGDADGVSRKPCCLRGLERGNAVLEGARLLPCSQRDAIDAQALLAGASLELSSAQLHGELSGSTFFPAVNRV